MSYIENGPKCKLHMCEIHGMMIFVFKNGFGKFKLFYAPEWGVENGKNCDSYGVLRLI